MRFLKRWLPLILWAAMILSASNDRFSATNSRSFLERLLGRDVPDIVNIVIRKAAHVGVYGVLGALAWRADRRVAVALMISLGVALADEINQAMTVTRTGSVWDVILDMLGAVGAVGVLTRLSRT
jgi:VanZ family protein